ncbi:hypothetical protein CIB84_012634, partial [Bambusicola thoracicus]
INGSAIENFSCVIYGISLMNCTWQAGRNAPGDTQYFLYWQNSRDDDQTECELYTKDENDRNTGCKFQNVTIKDKTTYFLVNGSHKAFLIQFYDNYTKLYTIERLPPPLNVTANCTSHPGGCIITWHHPLLSHVENADCFEYEINIQNKDETPEEKKDPPVIRLVVDKYHCSSGQRDGRNIQIFKMSETGTLTKPINLTLANGQFSALYCSLKRIFPPIPQPRDKFDTPAEEDIQ